MVKHLLAELRGRVDEGGSDGKEGGDKSSPASNVLSGAAFPDLVISERLGLQVAA